MNKTKILIAGIGGVGGYFGGLMAHYFEDDPNVEIYFLARGEHLSQIQTQGLEVVHGEKRFIARPSISSAHASDFGIVDYVIVCTKTYDLSTVISQLGPSIDDHTIIVPLLNGVDNQAIIQSVLPNNLVVDGCVYIISRLKQAGLVENSGNIQKLFLGQEGITDERLDHLAKLMAEANIEVNYTTEIKSVIWEKFIFLSPTATATSYFDQSIGAVLADPKLFLFLQGLIEEVRLLALAKQRKIAKDISAQTIAKLKRLPFETTSSMHSDFIAKKAKTELASLTAYVLLEAPKYQIKTPNYQQAFQKLSR